MTLKSRHFRLSDEVTVINKSCLEKAITLHAKLLGAPKAIVGFHDVGVYFWRQLAYGEQAAQSDTITSLEKTNATKATLGTAARRSRAKAAEATNVAREREQVAVAFFDIGPVVKRSCFRE